MAGAISTNTLNTNAPITTISNQQILDAVNNQGGNTRFTVRDGYWTLVYGPGKNSGADASNLLTAAEFGADIKVRLDFANPVVFTCNKIQMLENGFGKDSLGFNCYSPIWDRQGPIPQGRTQESYLVMFSLASGNISTTTIMTTNIKPDGTISSNNSDIKQTPIWYIKK